jgi:hypothetical protein
MLSLVILNDFVTSFWGSGAAVDKHGLVFIFAVRRLCCYFNLVCVVLMAFLPFVAFFFQWKVSDNGIVACNGFLVLEMFLR